MNFVSSVIIFSADEYLVLNPLMRYLYVYASLSYPIPYTHPNHNLSAIQICIISYPLYKSVSYPILLYTSLSSYPLYASSSILSFIYIFINSILYIYAFSSFYPLNASPNFFIMIMKNTIRQVEILASKNLEQCILMTILVNSSYSNLVRLSFATCTAITVVQCITP